ncbi:aarF domain-containing protein kinase 1-like [Saccostrea cucullata]|uniref:aarF domain-containing protein kinase 1-like n=1 Tax=Saccostrea cuccullata TaxID=36930 RepID=UPI002ED05964
MVLRKLWRVTKYGALGGAIGTTGYLLQKNDWDISTIGVVRFGQAAWAAVRLVADYKINLRGLDYDSPEYQKVKSEIHLRSALRLRDMCCTNGGAFIKVGQHVGSLEYLLPKEYVETMKVLHDKAPQSDVEELKRVFEEDLKMKVEDVFESFEKNPLGAASLAQVHKATLKDGTVLAVKIQHPQVKSHSYVDIKTMELLVHCIAWIFPGFQYMWLAEETKKNLPLELDFVHEGQNCERVERLFKHFRFLKVPKIHWELSSERVLTMEFCEGGKVDDKAYMEKHKIDVNEVSKNLGKLYSEMIFVQGYVHCDPHPGNVLVNKTEDGTQIILLDHGLYQTLTDPFRVSYSKLWMSLINADLEGIKKYSAELNCGDMYGLFACMLTARSWKAITSGIDKSQITQSESDEIKDNAANYLIEISEILNKIPREMLLILKTNDVLRGIEYSLNIRPNATSFLNMSRCCVQAVGEDEYRQCHSWSSRMAVQFSTSWQLLKISIYEFFLWLQSEYCWLLMQVPS